MMYLTIRFITKTEHKNTYQGTMDFILLGILMWELDQKYFYMNYTEMK